jgi:hypothetical protein
MTEKLTIPGEDGEPDRWINLRSHSQRMKSGERRKLYEIADSLNQKTASGSLSMLQHGAAHLIEDWYLSAPHPALLWKDGRPAEYVHMDAFDELDADIEDELLREAKWWMDRIALNFSPTPDPDSPTKPSDG